METVSVRKIKNLPTPSSSQYEVRLSGLGSGPSHSGNTQELGEDKRQKWR